MKLLSASILYSVVNKETSSNTNDLKEWVQLSVVSSYMEALQVPLQLLRGILGSSSWNDVNWR